MSLYEQLFFESNPNVLLSFPYCVIAQKTSAPFDSIRGTYSPIAFTNPIYPHISRTYLRIFEPIAKHDSFIHSTSHSIASANLFSGLFDMRTIANAYYAKNIKTPGELKDFIYLLHYPEDEIVILFICPRLLRKKDNWNPYLNEIRSGVHDKMLTFLKVKAVMQK